MRDYTKGFGGLNLLLELQGSAFPRALPFGIVAAIYSALVEVFAPGVAAALFEHTYPYHVIAFITGFGLIFRLNFSYQRYWESRSCMQNCAAKWGDGALQVLAFDEAAEGEAAVSGPAFRRWAVHLFSLLHAAAMHTLTHDAALDNLVATPLHADDASAASGAASQAAVEVSTVALPSRLGALRALRRSSSARHQAAYNAAHQIDVMGGVSDVELSLLSSSAERVHLVNGWLLRSLVVRRKEGGLATDGPVVSRIYQVLSDGMMWYLGALKIRDTPFPFPYAQLNATFCLINLCIFPLVACAKIESAPMAATVSGCAVTMMYTINEVARELEDPCSAGIAGSGANTLPVSLMQGAYNDRLVSCYHEYHAGGDGGGGASHGAWAARNEARVFGAGRRADARSAGEKV